MKKLTAVLLSLMLCLMALTVFVGCDKHPYTPEGKRIVNVHIPTQTPSLAMLKMLSDNKQIDAENYEINYNLEKGSDAIRAAMVNPTTKADIVIAPTHIIAEIANQQQNPVRYQIIAATSFGAFHLITTDSGINSFDDLEGKTIFCQGDASVVSGYILKYLLNESGIEANIEFSSTVPALLKQGTATIGIVPEPALSTVKKALSAEPNSKAYSVLDLQDIWETITGQEDYPIACLAVRKDFLEANKEFCTAFAEEVKKSVEWITTTAAPAEIAETITKVKTDSQEILDTGVDPAFFNANDPDSIDRLNIKYVPANKASITYYLTVMGIFDNMFYIP